MSVLSEQKSQLAKLMATENITVQHANIQTAGFDTKNRVLYLPIWKDMNGVLYDLLGGHEVGHALYTPSEGWHSAATDPNKGKNYKSFLNVVEDARIEKKVKRKYPGLRSSFTKAYQILFEKDFFGIGYRDINDMPFIDRLNIFTKSQYTAEEIKFSVVEQKLLQKVIDLETWDDVVRVTDEIYQYSKGEQQLRDQSFDNFPMFDQNDEGDEFGDSSDSFDSTDSSEDDEFEKTETDTEGQGGDEESDLETKSQDEDTDGDGDTDSDEEFDSDGDESEMSSINRQKDSKSSTTDQYSPTCETDDIYRERETSLLDDKCKNYVYIEIPKPVLSRIVTPAKRVHQLITEYYDQFPLMDKSERMSLVNEFKSKNERYIALLAKEFEMRKAAKAYSKSKISETGDLDIGKLATYKFNDNIFRKVTSMPKGKSHGLVLLLDRSGSMSSNMAGSIEQILILSLFCRKVNIPFVVYGFGDAVTARKIDFPNQTSQEINRPCFEENENNLVLNQVFLREYLNSKMSNVEFTKCLTNMISLKNSYENRYKCRPPSEEMSNTPLTQAIVALAPIMQEFRKVNNLDITNLVIIHDGDADRTNSYVKRIEDYNGNTRMQNVGFDQYSDVNIIRDSVNKFEFKLDVQSSRDNQVYDGILNWFKKVTGSKVFGFYIAPTTYNAKAVIGNHYVMEDGRNVYQLRRSSWSEYKSTVDLLVKKFRADKFLSNKCGNFDEFYIVAGGDDLKTEKEEIEIEGKVTAGKLKNAFMKFNKKRAVNRVLVGKFIQGISV
jgi:hypothetical protein